MRNDPRVTAEPKKNIDHGLASVADEIVGVGGVRKDQRELNS